MKIYDKKVFTKGVSLLSLGIIWLISFLRFKNNPNLFLAILFILDGIQNIINSLDKGQDIEDKIYQQDERNVLLKAKASVKTVMALEIILYFITIILVISYIFFQKEFIFPYLIITLIAMIVIRNLEIYYRNKLEKDEVL